MRDSWKVARWEIKRNLKNKSFLVSTLLTPLIFLFFALIGSFAGGSGDEEAGNDPMQNGAQPTIYVIDEADVFIQLEQIVEEQHIPLALEQYDGDEETLREQVRQDAEQAYMVMDEEALSTHQLVLHAGEDFSLDVQPLRQQMEHVLQSAHLDEAGLSAAERAQALTPVSIALQTVESPDQEQAEAGWGQWVPGIFSGIILFSIVITGMMTFNSSMQEKKDKIAEMLLASVSSKELMQGKIIGYFIIGLLQVGLWMAFGIPIVQFYFDLPIISHLLVPETLLLLLYALAGYLLFSAMYVALGATIDDFSTAGNFQGLVMMLPFLPFPFIWSFISDPAGIVAQVASYIPFSTSAVMIIRYVVYPELPWYEIVLSLGILLLSVWIMTRLAGKIYRTGMLMYGKNATPAEIWRWIRHS